MPEKLTCSNCKTTFVSEIIFAQFRPGGTLCPDCRRNKQLMKSLQKASSVSQSNQKREVVYVSSEPSAETILANAKAGHIEYELSQKKKADSADRPWMFDDNFTNEGRIKSITFPNNVDDIEKTISRLIKGAMEKCKSSINLTHSEFQQSIMGDYKAMWNPFYEEVGYVEACIEKSNEGIRKLRRFEDSSNVSMIVTDCQENLNNLSYKWLPALIDKREQKKKHMYLTVGVVIVLFAAMMIGLNSFS